ncbi:MAG: hypothetical protein M1828_006235 [Chrysothrix sp. TS-e1954]|nr:MAG: hypothetical protein M1828_006235 [Chrysothrix sp. TS-e1954]
MSASPRQSVEKVQVTEKPKDLKDRGVFKSLFKSGKFSDFTLEYQGKEYKLHRAVVCGQSVYFDALCSSKLKEASECRVEDAFAPNAITLDRMIQWLYEGSYTAPESEKGAVPKDRLTDIAMIAGATNASKRKSATKPGDNKQDDVSAATGKRKGDSTKDTTSQKKSRTTRSGQAGSPIGVVDDHDQAVKADSNLEQTTAAQPSEVPQQERGSLLNVSATTVTNGKHEEDEGRVDVKIEKKAWLQDGFNRAILAHSRVWQIADYYQIMNLQTYAEERFSECCKLWSTHTTRNIDHFALTVGEILQNIPLHAKNMREQAMHWAGDAGHLLLQNESFKGLLAADEDLNAAYLLSMVERMKAVEKEQEQLKHLIDSVGFRQTTYGMIQRILSGDRANGSCRPSSLPKAMLK